MLNPEFDTQAAETTSTRLPQEGLMQGQPVEPLQADAGYCRDAFSGTRRRFGMLVGKSKKE